MRVRWETGDIVVGIFRAEFIEHQKRIEALDPRATEDASEFDPGTIRRGLAGVQAEYCAK
ncbi:hypothetical protein D3C73_1477210 [compost metagenome]